MVLFRSTRWLPSSDLTRGGRQSFSVKGQIVNTFVVEGHVVSVATVQSAIVAKAAIDNTQANGHGWVLIELY